MYLLDCLYMCIHGHMDIHMMLLEVVHCTFACNIQTCTYTNTYVYIYIYNLYLFIHMFVYAWLVQKVTVAHMYIYIYIMYISHFLSNWNWWNAQILVLKLQVDLHLRSSFSFSVHPDTEGPVGTSAATLIWRDWGLVDVEILTGVPRLSKYHPDPPKIICYLTTWFEDF